MNKSMSIIPHLKLELLGTINNELMNVLYFHSKSRTGFHSIPRELFCYIDYLGSIRYGPPSQSKKAIQYLEKYMFKVNPRYKQIGRLIYELWRHGTVHEFAPKSLIDSCNRQITWQTNITDRKVERECHLECFKKQGEENLYFINVNLFQLTDDLISSIEFLIEELNSDKRLCREVQKNFNKISKPVCVKNLKGSPENIEILDKQILNAIKDQCREVKRGMVVIK